MELFDISEEQITKRQHYVPKAYLKYFSVDEQKTPHVYAVFPNGKEPQKVSIEKICCSSYFRIHSDIFPDGKVKYFLRKCDILLSQCDICPKGHVVVSLRDDLNSKCSAALLQQSIFP